MKRRTIIDLCVFVIGSVLVTFIFTKLPIDQKTAGNLFTLYGTFASLFGIWVAYQQILEVKETTMITKLEVEKSTMRLNQIFSISDLSKAIKIIHEIQQFLNYKKNELALLRMKDLKSILIEVKHSQKVSELSINEKYNSLLTDLSIDITNLNDILIGHKTGINISKVHHHLESIETFINNLESELKHRKL